MTAEQLHELVASFVQMVAELPRPAVSRHAVSTLRVRRRDMPAKWRDMFGIYAFVQDGEVVYVGRAARDTLAHRIHDQMRDRGDPTWNAVLSDEATFVEVFPFEERDWIWVPSLEVFLIQEGVPTHNKRRC
jgi:hypothetical protein